MNEFSASGWKDQTGGQLEAGQQMPCGHTVSRPVAPALRLGPSSLAQQLLSGGAPAPTPHMVSRAQRGPDLMRRLRHHKTSNDYLGNIEEEEVMCPRGNDEWAKFSQKLLIKLLSQEQDKYILFPFNNLFPGLL